MVDTFSNSHALLLPQVMPQLLHFLKVDQDTQLNKFKCLNSDQSGADLSPDSSIKDKSDIFVNKTNEVINIMDTFQNCFCFLCC